jgi:stage II sporulation protein GA (sporulation sigma-E factor processing peptidase)
VIVLIVYADVLIFLNLIVNYFLLCACFKILKQTPKTIRVILSAILGGVSSLYIFLPKLNILLEAILKIITCALMSLICFGFKNIKSLLKNIGVLFTVTCAYGGIMFAFWLMFNPKGMVINNSVVYFNISPLALIIFSVAAYIIFSIFSLIFGKISKFANKCSVTVFADDKNIRLEAIIDTGNSIEDIFSNSQIIIADKAKVEKLFSPKDKSSSRYRILPCNTVSGSGVLEGFRCDSAVIISNNEKTVLQKPILAISKTDLADGYDAIINPESIR